MTVTPFTIEDSLDVKELKNYLLQYTKGVIYLKNYPDLKIIYDVETTHAKLEFKEPVKHVFLFNNVDESILPSVMQPLRETMEVVRQELILESTLPLRSTGS